MRETQIDPLAEFRRTNVEGTENLARQAVIAGVVHLVYLSSVKINGESTTIGHPLRAGDKPRPQDPFGISKIEAE
jgi:nucleoside-diphosphate-sugar epimerase